MHLYLINLFITKQIYNENTTLIGSGFFLGCLPRRFIGAKGNKSADVRVA